MNSERCTWANKCIFLNVRQHQNLWTYELCSSHRTLFSELLVTLSVFWVIHKCIWLNAWLTKGSIRPNIGSRVSVGINGLSHESRLYYIAFLLKMTSASPYRILGLLINGSGSLTALARSSCPPFSIFPSLHSYLLRPSLQSHITGRFSLRGKCPFYLSFVLDIS